MMLTEENYYQEKAHFSTSSFKSFMNCPARAMAVLRGEWTQGKTKALLLGSYVDEALTGTEESLQAFLEENAKDIFKRNGDMYAEFEQAKDAIERIKKQPLMMHYLSGEHQVIMTGEIAGIPFKGKFDSYKPGEWCADLKYLRSLKSHKPFESIVDTYGYDIQGAVYRELIRQNTGLELPFYLVICTKEQPPRMAVCEINSYNLDSALEKVKTHVKRFADMKRGVIPAERCESNECDYCASTRILTEPIDSEILGMSKKQLDAMQGLI